MQQKSNFGYQPEPQLLSFINYLTQKWQICQNEVEVEKLDCAHQAFNR